MLASITLDFQSKEIMSVYLRFIRNLAQYNSKIHYNEDQKIYSENFVQLSEMNKSRDEAKIDRFFGRSPTTRPAL